MNLRDALLIAALHLSPSMSQPEAMELAVAIQVHAKLEKVDAWTMLALAWEESRLRKDARNERTGCLGYWQLAASNRRTLTDEQAMRAWDNARIAAKLLRSYWMRCGSTAKALGRYGGRAGQCSATSRARKILRLRDQLEREFGKRAA